MVPDEADIEQMLRRYRVAGPPEALREKILGMEPAEQIRRWPTYAFRAGIAASLLFSVVLLNAAHHLNQATAAHIGVNPLRRYLEAQEAARRLDADSGDRASIAFYFREDVSFANRGSHE